MKAGALTNAGILVFVFAAMCALAEPEAPATVAHDPKISEALQHLLYALADGDESAVADAMVLPESADHDQRILYARQLVLASRFNWLLTGKFGMKQARIILFHAKLDSVPWLDPDALQWEPLGDAHGHERMIAQAPDHQAQLVMTRVNDTWKLDRSSELPLLIKLSVQDAPWRVRILNHVTADIQSGKLTDAKAITDALLPHPTSQPLQDHPDRSTPAGAIAWLDEAIDRGDVDGVADSFRYLDEENDSPAQRKLQAERIVANHALAKALLVKFGEKQGRSLLQVNYLGTRYLDTYRAVGWEIDGDVARAAMPQGWYDAGMRMMRQHGIWRILWAAENAPDQKEHREQTARARAVLANLDQYDTPARISKALADPAQQQPQQDSKEYAKELRANIAEAKRQAATQRAASPQEQFQRDLGMTCAELTLALLSKDPAAAAKYYCADGDDGSYVLAREKRAIAARDMLDTEGSEIGGRIEQDKSVQLLSDADDLYALVMIRWTIHGDRAVDDDHTPDGMSLRKIDGVWKIDVTRETNGNSRLGAQYANEDAAKLSLIAEQIRQKKINDPDRYSAALRAAGIHGVGK